MVLKALYALHKPGLTKTLKIMKITAIILLSACLTASANGYSQKVTLSEKNARLEKVFTSIKQQTGYEFLYTDEMLQNTEGITVDLKSVDLTDALNVILKNQPLTYSILEKTIVLRPKTNVMKDELLSPPITVRGRLVDERGEGVLATITVNGTNRATSTNAEGYFELKDIDQNAILNVTGVNIESFIIPIKGKTDIGTIIVKIKVQNLTEVIIKRGYWEEKKETMVGSVTRIEAKDLQNQPVTSTLMALQGRVPGMQITPRSGVPGNAPTIIIRGQTSLRGDGNFPLYIVDGVPIQSDPIPTLSSLFIPTGHDPLSTINLSSIESIEVLKDADATAIYGSRGANGVILITTKQGSKTGSPNVDVNIYRGIGEVNRRVKLLGLTDYLAMRREAFANDGVVPNTINARDLLYWDTTRFTDWQDVLLGNTSNVLDAQVNVSGGNNYTSYRLSTGYHRETYVTPGDFFYSAITGQFTLSSRSKDSRLKTYFSLNFGVNKNRLFDEANFVVRAVSLAPTAPAIYKPDGTLNWAPYPGGGSSWDNPLSYIMNTHDAATRSYVASSNIKYDLFKGIVVGINLGYTDIISDEIRKKPIAALAPDLISTNSTGENTFLATNRRSWLIEPQISFNRKFKKNQIDIVLGSTINSSGSKRQTIQAKGYTADIYLGTLAGVNPNNISIQDNVFQYQYISMYGRFSLIHNSKYLLNLTARRDGSSRFGPGKQFGNFGSAAIGWIFSKEKFLDNSKFLNFGKLRASFGVTGNDQIGDYQYYNLYNFLVRGYQGGTSLEPSALFNPNFRWESTTKMEVGIELSFLNKRISTEFSFYKHRSSNQLINDALSSVTGFNFVFRNFNATVENSGLEGTIQSKNIVKKNFVWSTSMNFYINRNKLVSFPGIESSSYKTFYKVGEPLSIQRRYVSKGVNSQTGLYEVEDINSDGLINDQDLIFSSPLTPRFMGGINNILTYKNIELSFLFQVVCGDQSRGLENSTPPGYMGNQPEYLLRRWQKPGQNTDVQKFSQSFVGSTPYFIAGQSTYNIQNASFFRLKTLSLNYSIPQKWLSHIPIKEGSLFIQAQNLFTLTKYIGLDPETGNNQLPPLRIITLGAQFKF